MIMCKVLQQRIEDLEKEVSRLRAERQTLYSLIDKLQGCIDATNQRTDGETSHIEEVEDRILSLEAFKDRVEERLFGEVQDGTTDG